MATDCSGGSTDDWGDDGTWGEIDVEVRGTRIVVTRASSWQNNQRKIYAQNTVDTADPNVQEVLKELGWTKS